MTKVVEIVNKINGLIELNFPRDTKRIILYSIKTKHYIPYDRLIKVDASNLNKNSLENLKTLMNIHMLYREMDIPESEYKIHWVYNYQTQHELHLSYKTIVKPIRQDNKTYINYGRGNHAYFKGKIRFPRKCRKTAWKRFNRLFKDLNI